MRLGSIKRLRQHSPNIISGLLLTLAYCSFAVTFIAWTRWQVEVLYVFPVLSARQIYSGDAYTDEIYRDAIIKELWQRAVVPPLAPTCFTDHAIACDFADEFFEPSLDDYLLLLLLCLVPVVVNQWLSRQWVSVGTAVPQFNHATQ
jgi:hypothetical protein